MTDHNEKLIEEAAEAMLDAARELLGVETIGERPREMTREYARRAFAVFEKAHTPTKDEREVRAAVRRAVGGVLFNVSNFPDRAQSKLWGVNMGPLNEKITDAVLDALGQAHAPTDDELAKQITALHWGVIRDDALSGDIADAGRASAALLRRSEVPEPRKPGEHGGTVPLYGMLDVWHALYGTSHPEFDEFYAEHGYAETWARILAAVRERREEPKPQGECPKCGVKVTDQTASTFYTNHDETCGGTLEEPQGEPSSELNARESAPHLQSPGETKAQGEPSDAQVATEPSAQDLVDYIFNPEEDDESGSIRYGLIFEMLADLRLRAAGVGGVR